MRVLVLGSGVIGTSVAYYLARSDHEVTVVDRQPGAALETSYANAGEVSPGYASPWAGPGVPVKAIKWLLMRHGPLVIWPKLDPVMWIWGLKMLRNCTEERYAINKSRMIPIAEYSRDCLRALRAEIGIKYDERSQGTLQLFRKQKQLDSTGGDIAVLKQYGVPYEVLDRAGCIAAEPALAGVKDKIAGGLRLPLEGVMAVVPVRLDPLADRVDHPVERGLRGCDQLSHPVPPVATHARKSQPWRRARTPPS